MFLESARTLYCGQRRQPHEPTQLNVYLKPSLPSGLRFGLAAGRARKQSPSGPGGTTPPRATAESECICRAPRLFPGPEPEDQLCNWKNRRSRQATPRASAAERAVSSNSNPPRPRTPPPAQAAAQQRGADQRLIRGSGCALPRETRGRCGQRRPPEEGRQGGACVEGSGRGPGDSPWEGPSGPGSAGAAGLEDRRARNASAQRARPGAAVAGRDLRGGPRHRSGAGHGAGGPWRAGGRGPHGGLRVRRPIGAGAWLQKDAERDRGGGGRTAEGSPRPNHCSKRGSPAPTNAEREGGGPEPTNAERGGRSAQTNAEREGGANQRRTEKCAEKH